MLRLVPCLVLACDPTVIVFVDAPPAIPPQDDRGPFDAGSSIGDAPLTLCEEARQHSDFAWIEVNVFERSCATASCHTGPDAAVGLRLDRGFAHANLVGRPSSTQTGWMRVLPGSVNTSYLVVALGRAFGPPPSDGYMPLGAPALCVEIHEAIERWIVAGAQ